MSYNTTTQLKGECHMNDITEAIEEHKRNCQELQTEKFKNIEETLDNLMIKLDKLLEFNTNIALIDQRLKVVEDKIAKRSDKIMAWTSFTVSLLLALYVLIPKFVK